MKNLLIGISNANNHLLKEILIDDALNMCITEIGHRQNIDRCYIFKNEIVDQDLKLNYVYEWCNDGIDSYLGSPELNGLSYDDFPGLYNTLINDEPLYGLVKDSDNKLFVDTMEMQGIKSYLFTPIFSENKFWGWIGYDDCKTERQWVKEDVYALHTVAKNIGLRLNQDKTNAKLELSEEKFRFIADNTTDLITQHFIDGTYSYVSTSSKDIIGFNAEELILKNLFDFIHPDDINLMRNVHQEIFNKLQTKPLTYRFQKKDNSYIWMESVTKVILNNKHQTIGMQSSSRDITETIKAAEEMRLNLLKEKELNELKSKFVSMASHQFRTPLTIIYSNAELIELKSKIDATKSNDGIDLITNRIKNEVDRLTELINNILIFGKYELEETRKDIKEVDFEILINTVIGNYFNNELDYRKISITTNGKKQKIKTDETLLTHIITNIVGNAFKYSANKPSPKLIITYFEKKIKVEIIDFGIGIPTDEIQHIFTSFFRATNTSTIVGSGLGLTIVKQFTDLLKGKITIESQENLGTTVILILPYE